MTRQPSSFGDILHSWTEAEREVWNTWSNVEQDISAPADTAGCAALLEPMERTVVEMARLHSSAVRATMEVIGASPFVPEQGRAMLRQVYAPLVSMSEFQQHLVAGWFGMARQMMQLSSGVRRA